MKRALGIVLLAASACNGTEVTSVKLRVSYDEAWQLSALDVTAGEATQSAPLANELRLLLPDDWDGDMVTIAVTGLRGPDRWAYGRVAMVPVRGREVTVNVALSRLPCGAWCEPEATRCLGDGVAICEQRDDDDCLEWSNPVPCGEAAPFCSGGACRADCFDECAPGETRCEGPGAVVTCGDSDTDDCQDWSPPLACASGTVCSDGTCRDVCLDECTDGEVQCLGSGTITCGDLNVDGCTEWSPVTPCPVGTCSDGACSDTCTDECSDTTCDGLTLRTCGNFDADDCTELSPGTSCVPGDLCREGMCSVAEGCTSAPLVCMDAPDNECLDADTLRGYDTVGTCTGGSCDYAFADIDCPNCPSCDPCEDVVCDMPPAPVACYLLIGTCTDGSCGYDYNDGADCSDGDACRA